jgi:hypothetical protein
MAGKLASSTLLLLCGLLLALSNCVFQQVWCIACMLYGSTGQTLLQSFDVFYAPEGSCI